MKRKKFSYGAAQQTSAHALNEMAAAELPPGQINVRAAKDKLSSLLDHVSHGYEIIITSDGKPKAKLIPVHPKRKKFLVDWDLLNSMPLRKGPSAGHLLREERDGRP
jgi:prevent-host-death family protein